MKILCHPLLPCLSHPLCFSGTMLRQTGVCLGVPASLSITSHMTQLRSFITLANLGCVFPSSLWSGITCREKTTVPLLWRPQTLGNHITMASYNSLLCQNKREPLSPRTLGRWVLVRPQSTRKRGRGSSLLEAVFSFLLGAQGRDV